MGRAAGLGLRGVSTFLYVLEFCCAAAILAIFAYFLANLVSAGLYVNPRWSAVIGMSGGAVVFSFFAVIFTCFLGGVSFFAILAIVFDLLFVGAFIAIAYFTRAGAYSCNGNVNTPIGTSAAGYGLNAPATYNPNLYQACQLNKACFALAIAAACLFLFSTMLQIFVWMHHKKEKRYGPGPNNDYTSGSGYREKALEPVPVVVAPAPEPVSYIPDRTHHVRPSADTGYTDTTAVAAVDTYAPVPAHKNVVAEELPTTVNGPTDYDHVEHVVPVIPVSATSATSGVHAPASTQYGDFRGMTPGQIAVGPTGHLPVEDGPLDHGALHSGYGQYSGRTQAYTGNNF